MEYEENEHDLRHPHVFKSDNEGRLICMVCPKAVRWRMAPSEARRHEETRRHVFNVRALAAAPMLSGDGGNPDDPSASSHELPTFETVDHDIPPPHIPAFRTFEGPRLHDDPPDLIYDDWADPWGPSADIPVDDDGEDNDSHVNNLPHEPDAAQGSLLAEVEPASRIHSDGVQRSKAESNTSKRAGTRLQAAKDADQSEIPPLRVYEPGADAHLEPQRVSHPEDWWPWPDAATATATQLSAFPRSLFSERDMDTAVWLARQCGADIAYTVRQLNSCRDEVSHTLGPPNTAHKGALGSPFAMLDFGKIIADEWANPCVRPHLRTYAEDSGEKLSAPYNASKWREEVNPALSGPMVRAANGRDYYVEEPALVTIGSTVHAVMPLRWFERADRSLWGRVRALGVVSCREGDVLAVDARVDCFDVPLSSFLANYEDLRSIHNTYELPEPSRIEGIIQPDGSFLKSPIVAPHPIRLQAKGKRVYTPPIWMFCDDTSGNTSKKWNKHNSLLFTLAGLPPDLIHLLYNIQFLATSNIASPLEMFEVLVDKLKEIREKGGIEAYDCVHHEVVLLLPWVLGMNGDNPMQSEFASHIGLAGKCFCRACHARNDNKSRKAGDTVESERIDMFMFPQEDNARTREEVLAALEKQLEAVLDGAPTRAEKQQRETGVKDRYFEHFFEKLSAECGRIKERLQAGDRTVPDLKVTLKKLRDTMPKNIFNPALRLEEFDPCRDTPVEILHVILLGFVKYFWRDAVSRLSQEGKETLKARIESFDVTGLGIPKARGQLLVQYAGSLTGRDFRVILQLAPSVLLGLIPTEAYETWLALCRLAPLAFQPTIENKTRYLADLEFAVQDFLACTAMWTTQWFNKPKFHILLHIAEHVRRFGPALHSATESFESYNFVIRLRSIHSSRHAPSTDIGSSFARMHTVRHLVSGGYVQDPEALAQGAVVWRQAGKRVLDFPDDPLYAKLMGMSDLKAPLQGGVFSPQRRQPPVLWSATRAGAAGYESPLPSPKETFRFCKSVVLESRDEACVNGFILIRLTNDEQDLPRVARVIEIIAGGLPERVLGLLLQPCVIGDVAKPYYFPSVRADDTSQPIWASIDKCLAAIGTIHDCASHDCRVTPTRVQRKERQEMKEHGLEVTHDSPEDRLLNLAQLRSASTLHFLCPRTQRPDSGISRERFLSMVLERRRVADQTGTRTTGKSRTKRPAVEEAEVAPASLDKRPRSQTALDARTAGPPAPSRILAGPGGPSVDPEARVAGSSAYLHSLQYPPPIPFAYGTHFPVSYTASHAMHGANYYPPPPMNTHYPNPQQNASVPPYAPTEHREVQNQILDQRFYTTAQPYVQNRPQ